jgi:hypothetical protein
MSRLPGACFSGWNGRNNDHDLRVVSDNLWVIDYDGQK